MPAAARPEREDAVLGELSVSLLVAPQDEVLPELTGALVALASELPGGPPLGALLDAVALLLLPVVRLDEARRRLHEGRPVCDALGAAVGRWLDAFLAPVASSPAFLDVRDALRRHDTEERQRGAALVGSEMVGRWIRSEKAEGRVDTGMLRRVLERPATELRTRGAAALLSSHRREQLVARYDALVAMDARRSALVTKTDLLLATNAPVLRSRAARTGLRQLAEAAAEMGRRVPRVLRHKGPRGDDVTSRVRAEGTYPMGGFSSMSNTGSLESVVSSELAYLSPGADLADDLFTLRWALGELLYYTRDESVTSRPRTTFSIHLAADLILARHKDPDAPYQRATLALASVVVLITRAIHLFRGEALRFRLAFDPALDAERNVLALALVREREAKLVEIVTGEEPDASAFEIEEGGRARVVALRVTGTSREQAGASRARTLVAASQPSIDGLASAGPGSIEAWAQIVRTLLVSV